MQRTTPILFVVGGLVALGLALGQSLAFSGPLSGPAVAQEPVEQPQDPALLAKVDELERKVATLETWVTAQQTQSKLTVAALAAAEAKGFTAGINFESREILLAAWRAEEATVQAAGPGAPQVVVVPEPKGDTDDRAVSAPR